MWSNEGLIKIAQADIFQTIWRGIGIRIQSAIIAHRLILICYIATKMPLRKSNEQFQKALLIFVRFTTGMWEKNAGKSSTHAWVLENNY